MEIRIRRMDDGNILTAKNYDDVESRGEIAHFIAELENIKLELLELWMDYEQ